MKFNPDTPTELALAELITDRPEIFTDLLWKQLTGAITLEMRLKLERQYIEQRVTEIYQRPERSNGRAS